jgi:hypothetical protein
MLRERFLKIYANLPLNLRDEIILVLPDMGSITWDIAYLEVKQNTKVSKEILKMLNELNII